MNAESVELQEVEVELLESQLAQQQEAEAARQQQQEAEALAVRQRLLAARLLEQGEVALNDGETDLADDLASARSVLVEEVEIARRAGRYAHQRELSEALILLDAAEIAADANNGLEARQWLLEARELLVGPDSTGAAVTPYGAGGEP